MAEHEHVCVQQQTGPHAEMFGCKCACGSVRHWMGWQQIRTLIPSEPKNPCAVILEEPEFDVEDYRADLQRRYDSLGSMAASARDQWNKASEGPHRTMYYGDMNRYANKAAGIRIALDLLPRRTQ